MKISRAHWLCDLSSGIPTVGGGREGQRRRVHSVHGCSKQPKDGTAIFGPESSQRGVGGGGGAPARSAGASPMGSPVTSTMSSAVTMEDAYAAAAGLVGGRAPPGGRGGGRGRTLWGSRWELGTTQNKRFPLPVVPRQVRYWRPHARRPSAGYVEGRMLSAECWPDHEVQVSAVLSLKKTRPGCGIFWGTHNR